LSEGGMGSGRAGELAGGEKGVMCEMEPL
jgi:hypothetical protein